MRYYYTCPLAAAWMGKYFGVKFVAIGGNYSDHTQTIDKILECEKGTREGWQHCRFEIHPDSYHLLELKDGDMIKYRTGDAYITDGSNEISSIIIQRNGAPFMWPEYEKC